jgi:organic hydroperoxide reductase OsmC/OhrA
MPPRPLEEFIMSDYSADISWQRAPGEAFVDSRYSRAHEWRFDGGVVVPASSAVASVPLPYSKSENVDPEEALVAAAASCHMLSFLYVAARSRFVVDAYEDHALGTMSADEHGRKSITRIVLHPKVRFSGSRAPDAADVERMHHEAHEQCYIANSLRSEITVAGEWSYAAG